MSYQSSVLLLLILMSLNQQLKTHGGRNGKAWWSQLEPLDDKDGQKVDGDEEEVHFGIAEHVREAA